MLFAAALTLAFFSEVTDPGNTTSGLVIDLMDLEWWQSLALLIGGAISVLGLSPLPWIAGLAANRIQFTAGARADHDREIATLKSAHEAEIRNLNAYHAGLMFVKDERYAEVAKANEANRIRADSLTEVFAETNVVLRATTHVLESLDEVTREVTDGR